MAFDAARDVRLRKLPAVNVAVAVLACCRRRFEISIAQLHSHVRRLVAINACDRAMRSYQRELGGAVIEAGQIRPCFRRVADFAARDALGIRSHHAFFELPAVRILMTRRAGAIFKAIRDRFRFERILRLVTFIACSRDVAPGQHEPRILVARQGERRRPVSIQRVTLLALVEIRRTGELCLVFVLVAIGALREFNFVERRPACGDMTPLALHRRVLPLQRVRAHRVFFHGEDRRFEAFYSVAARALAAIGTLYKLAVMRIRLMAIRAPRMRHRFFEISPRVT